MFRLYRNKSLVFINIPAFEEFQKWKLLISKGILASFVKIDFLTTAAAGASRATFA